MKWPMQGQMAGKSQAQDVYVRVHAVGRSACLTLM